MRLLVLYLIAKITIYHAGSLTVPFSRMEKEFEKKTGIKIERLSQGSRHLIKRITDLGMTPDIIAVADYKLLYKLLPEYIDSFFVFARNEMVIAYTKKSKFADEINNENWYEILMKDGVRIGRSSPELDPCGYRALMVLQLAEDYYKVNGLYEKILKNSPDKYVRPKSVELLTLLETGEIDYAFEYLSVAKQHDLLYIKLPPEINLSSYKFSDFYKKACVVLEEKDTLYGEPILYGIAVLKNSPDKEEAEKFLEFLFNEGREILQDAGQPPLTPPVVIRDKSLKK